MCDLQLSFENFDWALGDVREQTGGTVPVPLGAKATAWIELLLGHVTSETHNGDVQNSNVVTGRNLNLRVLIQLVQDMGGTERVRDLVRDNRDALAPDAETENKSSDGVSSLVMRDLDNVRHCFSSLVEA